MSVTIDSEPNEVQPLAQFAFNVNLSDAGTDPVQNSLGYKFFGPGGSVLLDTSKIRYTGQAETLDFTGIVKSQLSTSPPTLGSTSLQAAPDFAKEFYLQAGVIAFDSDTCDTTITLDQTSSTITGINSLVQPWEAASRFDSGDLFALTYRPPVCWVNPDQNDWLYVFTKSGNCYYYVDLKFSDGTTQQVASFFSMTKEALGIPIGPANMIGGPFAKQIVSYDVYIRESPLLNDIAFFTFKVGQDCNDKPVKEFISVEPLGGISSLRVQNVTASAQVGGNTYQAAMVPGSAKSATEGGRTRLGTNGSQTFTLSGEMTYHEGLETWLAGLFSGRQTYIKYIDSYGERLVKCLVVDGQYQTFNGRNTRYSVTVELHYPIT